MGYRHRSRAARRGALVAGLVVLLASSTVTAGETGETDERRSWSVGVESGIQQLASRDELGSPLVYDGLGVPLVVRTDARRTDWSWGARISGLVAGFNAQDLTAPPAEDEPGGHRAEPVFFDLSSWVQWPVVRSGSLRLSAGPQLGHWTFFRSYEFHPAQIGSVEVWDAAITADLRAGLGQEFGQFDWELATSLALGGRMLRPSWAVRGDERIALVENRRRIFAYGDWTAVHRLQMVQLEAGMQWWPTDRWGISGRYRGGLLSYRGSETTTRAVSQQGTLGVQFRFQ